MTAGRPVYRWRDHLKTWHGLDPETYDLMDLLVLHNAANARGRALPHDHGACPRCGHVGGVTMPASIPATLEQLTSIGCDTCDLTDHHPRCHATGECLCGLDLLVYPLSTPTTEGTTHD